MTDKEIMRNRWIDRLYNVLGMLLITFVAFWLAGWRSNKDELEVKLNNKADITWVKEKMKEHEEKEKEMIQPLRDDLTIIKEYLLYGTKPKTP